MENFLKQNWFKIIITVAVLIIAVSVGYYFVIISVRNNDSLNQQRCADQAVKAYKSLGYPETGVEIWGDTSDSYTDHYNKKLNKCFIEIAGFNGSDEYSVYDANELKDYFDARETNYNTVGEVVPTHLICAYNGGVFKNCESGDFDKIIKSYMEN